MKSIDDALLSMLACGRCGSHAFQSDGGTLVCKKCQEDFLLHDGKVFFIDTPKDAPKKDDAGSTDRGAWSDWRTANFEYFQNIFQGELKDKVVLDLGTGVAQFRELWPRFGRVYGVDFFPYHMVSVVTDLTRRLPFQDHCSDVIILSNVLEHIPNPQHFLEECYRVLKRGGVIVGAIPFLMRIHQKPYDYNRFTNFMLEKLLSSAQFQDIEVRNLGTPFDVYKTMQFHFFCHLLDSKFSERRAVHVIMKLLARIVWRGNKMLMFVFAPLYRIAAPSSDYTQGYGFKAYK